MAPINSDLQNVQEDVKNVIQDLFQILVQVSNYDALGRSTRDALAQDFQTLDATLRTLHTTALTTSNNGTTPNNTDRRIPEPLLHYVENGRNPDIYTREFVELVRRMNQLARGKARAFGGFRDVLAREMGCALPELRADVGRVLEATGGGGGDVALPEGGDGEGSVEGVKGEEGVDGVGRAEGQGQGQQS
ncbi:hypothetical protein N658DRAFT_460504 [Parathielavia hyrcaniae]|uniref:Mediator of RNA polymerase II transcription subunit 10 n=1 Tax=Parathielavia hyrcaniae TaxID=113614 RepID=A0AAN6T6W4_9PEZI|nr:hypothetical protein N658DRAFT_460504 [Parathielavia hyrcaniae]